MRKIPRAHDSERRTYPALEYGVDPFKAAAIKLCLLSFTAIVLGKKEAWLSVAVHKNIKQGDAS